MAKIEFPPSLRGRLIVSCQAAPGDPMDNLDTLTRMAVSVAHGGAAGLRANGAPCVAAFRRATGLPVLGIKKRAFGNEISITPDFAAARALSEAGAEVLSLDCSVARHKEAEPWPELTARIHTELRLPVLADIATFEEAVSAEAQGADAVATTLYGFTPETAGARAVNWTLVERLARSLRVPLIVEGHITQPEEARRALNAGAFAVVIGSAITRPESITARFVRGLN